MKVRSALLHGALFAAGVLVGLLLRPAPPGPPPTPEPSSPRGDPSLPTPPIVGSRSTPSPATDDDLPLPAALAESLLLLTVDAFRADQPWSGYTKISTPALSSLAERSVVYTRAYSVANTTTASLVGLMSARYPTEIPRDDCGFVGFQQPAPLAKVLSAAGIHTMAAHAHAIFASSFAPSEGFDEWRVIPGVGGKKQEAGAITGDELATLLVSFLRNPQRPRRFFAWAHFVDPHDAYAAHADIPPSTTPLRGAYDAEVVYTDRAIGRVLTALREEGLDRTTAIVVTGDHGEAFGEHERFRHGHTVFEEEIRVPLLVRVPSVPAMRLDVPRSGIDFARTAAAVLGVAPSPSWRGVSWTDDWNEIPGERPIVVDTPAFANLQPLRAVVLGREKVAFRAGRPLTAFDLLQDPGEARSLDATRAGGLFRDAISVTSDLKFVPATPCRRDPR